MSNQSPDARINLLATLFLDKSIDSAFARFNTIITSLKALDEGYFSKNYVRKFLRALHPKWRAKVMVIEKSKELTSLSLDELNENLKVHEMIIKKDSEIVKAKGEIKSLALKAKKESSDKECSTSGKCPKPPKDKNQRAFVRGSWSDSGEEDDEKVMDKTCLIALASNEICLGVDLEPDEWIKDSECSKHMTGNRKLFSSYKAYNGGNVIFGSNLRGQICDNKCRVTFSEHDSEITMDDKVIGRGPKWLFRNKLDENSVIVRNKARLVAQGYNQQEGIDYDETYALVARPESIRILLAYTCALDFKLFQIDVKSAFLNSFINDEVYVAQPPGFIDFEKPDHVYKLKKALPDIMLVSAFVPYSKRLPKPLTLKRLSVSFDTLKKQTALTISTTEDEYISFKKACQQALWMKKALIDYDGWSVGIKGLHGITTAQKLKLLRDKDKKYAK
nr:copia protein [Tanacetum cinerariifolium]